MGVYDGSGHAYHFYPGKTALAVSLLFRRLQYQPERLTSSTRQSSVIG